MYIGISNFEPNTVLAFTAKTNYESAGHTVFCASGRLHGSCGVAGLNSLAGITSNRNLRLKIDARFIQY